MNKIKSNLNNCSVDLALKLLNMASQHDTSYFVENGVLYYNGEKEKEKISATLAAGCIGGMHSQTDDRSKM